MTLQTQSQFPSRRTYVVKVRSDAKPDALTGRIENVATGRQHSFASAHELIDSIATDLQACDDKPADATNN